MTRDGRLTTCSTVIDRVRDEACPRSMALLREQEAESFFLWDGGAPVELGPSWADWPGAEGP
jgi:hypothetical protein